MVPRIEESLQLTSLGPNLSYGILKSQFALLVGERLFNVSSFNTENNYTAPAHSGHVELFWDCIQACRRDEYFHQCSMLEKVTSVSVFCFVLFCFQSKEGTKADMQRDVVNLLAGFPALQLVASNQHSTKNYSSVIIPLF